MCKYSSNTCVHAGFESAMHMMNYTKPFAHIKCVYNFSFEHTSGNIEIVVLCVKLETFKWNRLGMHVKEY